MQLIDSLESEAHHRLLRQSPYRAYVYSYPHKSAYRTFDPPMPLETLWSQEDQRALFLYVHVPFCEMRCGFCNLFTSVQPSQDVVEAYLDALARQSRVVRGALDAPGFARVAIGGGTPTFLEADQLERVFDMLEGTMGARPAEVPTSVEVSPATATRERLAVLRRRGASRISIGVQSFVDREVASVHRTQDCDTVGAALERIRVEGFPTLNLDLMYGLPGQSARSWTRSLEVALSFSPEEVYLYPLYVRPLTRMGTSDAEWDDQRLALYRQGRDALLEAGYRQISMRMFRASHAPDEGQAPIYRCQEDGMVGLGCGARSYTRRVHYSSPFAVGPRHVKAIIRDYAAQSDEDFACASYGATLDDEELRRRFVILSLLSDEGLDLGAYRGRFAADATEDMPELAPLASLGLATDDGLRLRLTPQGVERSDAIGPWLFSEDIGQLMEGFDLK